MLQIVISSLFFSLFFSLLFLSCRERRVTTSRSTTRPPSSATHLHAAACCLVTAGLFTKAEMKLASFSKKQQPLLRAATSGSRPHQPCRSRSHR